ncbi:MAG TPA: hypothetical protein VH142_25395 [Polyangiaceae bacterium]|jgi:hypothetical protein|nr:hypothetical protein [Polyangiaceae bacterium]
MTDPAPRSRPPEARTETARWRFVAYVLSGLIAATAVVGWYDAGTRAEAERRAAAERLTATEQRLTETKSDLDHCKSWMDALMAQASAASDAAPRAPVVPSAATTQAAPMAPAASGSAEPTPDDVAQGLSNGDDAFLVQRRRRMLETRGQLNSVEAREPPP